ncbi:hypothetical protein [Tenacibaculum sp. 190524A02b]|uniref:hypothetical protein n=1 Tax=Tenacibaculum vairaonense TaxID=3137860 RepID=UPI0031FA7EB5
MGKDSDIFNLMNKRQKTDFAEDFISHEQYHLHTINDVIIFSFLDEFGIVNMQSKHFQFFEDEEAALNHVLDFYKVTKNEQQLLNL